MALRFTCAYRSDRETFLHVSTRALDRAFAAANPELYAVVHEATVKSLMAYDNEDPLKAPIIGVYDGVLNFQNGRHRARAALRLGRADREILWRWIGALWRVARESAGHPAPARAN